MNAYHLKYFQDAARAASVGAAAVANRVSSSAVSQAIRSLERELGVELVVHARNRFELTEHGRRLAEVSNEVFDALNRVREEVRDLKRPPSGTLAFGMSHSVALSLMPEKLVDFSTKYPGILLNLKTGPSAQLKDMVRAGEVELAVFVDDGDLRGLHSEVIHSGHFILATSVKGYKRRGDKPFLITERRPDVDQFLVSYRRRHGVDAGVFMQIESWEIIAQLAALGFGAGFIPDFFLKGMLRPQLRVLDTKLPKVPYDLCVVRAKQRRLSRNAQLFWNALQKKARTPTSE